jgi:hypothetical protein
MGLRPLDLDEWLEVDVHREEDLALKRSLLTGRHADVVAVRTAGLAGSAETLDLVAAWLGRHHPGLPGPLPDPDLHPIDAAGRLVQEDLCVLTREESGWVLSAASVCFPSRWVLAEKIGRTVADIHEPVPGYERLSAVVDRSLDTLTVDRPLWRLNWTIVPSPDLHLPPAAGAPTVEELTVRVERQTLRRLRRSGAILFTIRTHRAPLSAVEAAPAVAERLRATLATVDPETAAYKGWSQLLPALLERLGDDTRRARA